MKQSESPGVGMTHNHISPTSTTMNSSHSHKCTIAEYNGALLNLGDPSQDAATFRACVKNDIARYPTVPFFSLFNNTDDHSKATNTKSPGVFSQITRYTTSYFSLFRMIGPLFHNISLIISWIAHYIFALFHIPRSILPQFPIKSDLILEPIIDISWHQNEPILTIVGSEDQVYLYNLNKVVYSNSPNQQSISGWEHVHLSNFLIDQHITSVNWSPLQSTKLLVNSSRGTNHWTLNLESNIHRTEFVRSNPWTCSPLSKDSSRFSAWSLNGSFFISTHPKIPLLFIIQWDIKDKSLETLSSNSKSPGATQIKTLSPSIHNINSSQFTVALPLLFLVDPILDISISPDANYIAIITHKWLFIYETTYWTFQKERLLAPPSHLEFSQNEPRTLLISCESLLLIIRLPSDPPNIGFIISQKIEIPSPSPQYDSIRSFSMDPSGSRLAIIWKKPFSPITLCSTKIGTPSHGIFGSHVHKSFELSVLGAITPPHPDFSTPIRCKYRPNFGAASGYPSKGALLAIVWKRTSHSHTLTPGEPPFKLPLPQNKHNHRTYIKNQTDDQDQSQRQKPDNVTALINFVPSYFNT